MTANFLTTNLHDRLRAVCIAEPRIEAVFLFGSQADGYVRPDSDIDLGLLLTEPLSLMARLDLEVQLCQALDRDDVDVVYLHDAPIALRFRAIQGQILYERIPDRVSDFMQRTMVEYYDFQHVLNTYEREFARSLEQDYDL
jgi:predicted nucleotidyltransferase